MLFLIGLSISPERTCGGQRTLTDAVGRRITVPDSPKRIVSLAPDITETLFALGLSEEIVGVTQFSDFPPVAAMKPKVGSYVDLNIEAIIDLNPDLILGTGAGTSPVLVKRLGRMGFSVFVVYPKDLHGVLAAIEQIADVVGREGKGRAIVEDMRRRIDRVSHGVAGRERRRVFLQIGRDPIYTVSQGSFAHHLITLAGGDNIANNAPVPYPSYSLEEIILQAPEVIIVTSMYTGGNQEGWIEEWRKWEVLPAVKEKRLYTIDSDIIDRPSPRIVDGLEEIARMIHPEVFPSESCHEE
jgi:iron complex transport system substrate-binding protein